MGDLKHNKEQLGIQYKVGYLNHTSLTLRYLRFMVLLAKQHVDSSMYWQVNVAFLTIHYMIE